MVGKQQSHLYMCFQMCFLLVPLLHAPLCFLQLGRHCTEVQLHSQIRHLLLQILFSPLNSLKEKTQSSMIVLYSQENVLSNGTRKPSCFNNPANIIHLLALSLCHSADFRICHFTVSSLMQFSEIYILCQVFPYYSTLTLKLKTLSDFQYNLFQKNPTNFFFNFPYIPTLPSNSNKNTKRIFN